MIESGLRTDPGGRGTAQVGPGPLHHPLAAPEATAPHPRPPAPPSGSPRAPVRPDGRSRGRTSRRRDWEETRSTSLAVLELIIAAAALVGGVALAVQPNGSLLSLDSSRLVGSPFGDWRLPGILLAALVGLGMLAAAVWQTRRGLYHRQLSWLAGVGLIAFELFALAWLGFQPVEAVAMASGAVVAALAAASSEFE